jgi:hypothetical protein
LNGDVEVAIVVDAGGVSSTTAGVLSCCDFVAVLAILVVGEYFDAVAAAIKMFGAVFSELSETLSEIITASSSLLTAHSYATARIDALLLEAADLPIAPDSTCSNSK